jgi:hypothetical protein
MLFLAAFIYSVLIGRCGVVDYVCRMFVFSEAHMHFRQLISKDMYAIAHFVREAMIPARLEVRVCWFSKKKMFILYFLYSCMLYSK